MNIDNLSKITFEIEINSDTGTLINDQKNPLRFDFIFGVSSSGLSSFEREIYKKSEGDTILISVPGALAPEYFGNAYHHIFQLVKFGIVPEVFNLKLRIAAVQQSEEREVIKAMTQSLGHSCGGGGCDCGCS
jgi:hypothetical protein